MINFLNQKQLYLYLVFKKIRVNDVQEHMQRFEKCIRQNKANLFAKNVNRLRETGLVIL